MFDHIAHIMDRFCLPVITGAGVTGGMLLATAPSENMLQWAERFGIPVVLLFLVIFAISKIIPPVVQWHLKHVDEMTKTFVEELKEERKSRESFAREQTAAMRQLTETLGDRPCQIPHVFQQMKKNDPAAD